MKAIFAVSFVVSLVCAVMVSALVVYLKPIKEKNRFIEIQTNILKVAGTFDETMPIDQQFEKVDSYEVDLTQHQILGKLDNLILGPDYAKNAKTSMLLDKKQDIASLKRLETKTSIFVFKDESGKLDKLVLPIRGYGLWSTLYGFIALEKDKNTIAGITFYQHGETPGLGGEVDNPKWKASWVGKKLFGEDNRLETKLVKLVTKQDHQIDALTGATLTSDGVSNMIAFWFGSQLGYKKLLDNINL